MGEWHGYAAAGMPAQGPAALTGVWAKMRRAKVHQDALVEQVTAYIGLPPYEIAETRSGDQMRIRAVATVPPPEPLALILGDLVQNLRAALDHLAWAFALTVKPHPSRSTAFPIMSARPKDFDAASQVADIPPSVRAIMEAMQPYQDEESVGGMFGHYLTTLARLSNTDKHQLLLVTQRLVNPKYISHSTPEGLESGIEFLMDPLRQWAEIRHPANGEAYDPHFEAQVTIMTNDLPWQSGLQGIAGYLYAETEATIAAFRGEWSLLQ